MTGARVAPVALALALVACGCGALGQVVAGDADLADYRAFRVAADEGTRLRRAQEYLEAHPRGRWTDEVRAAFDEEEPAFFARSQSSRDLARDYLAALPRGPHADAALALILAYDAKVDDVETARLLRDARRTEAQLESAAAHRRAVGAAILDAVRALLEDGVYGARVADAPLALRRAMGGAEGCAAGAPACRDTRTWGAPPARRDADLFFVLPAPGGREGRVASLTLALDLDAQDRIVAGRVEGVDLFVRWDEADLVRSLDGSSPNHRSEAAFHAADRLGDALESRLPAARCAQPAGPGELLRRACDGWSAVVRWSDREGGADAVSIRGPRAGEMR